VNGGGGERLCCELGGNGAWAGVLVVDGVLRYFLDLLFLGLNTDKQTYWYRSPETHKRSLFYLHSRPCSPAANHPVLSVPTTVTVCLFICPVCKIQYGTLLICKAQGTSCINRLLHHQQPKRAQRAVTTGGQGCRCAAQVCKPSSLITCICAADRQLTAALLECKASARLQEAAHLAVPTHTFQLVIAPTTSIHNRINNDDDTTNIRMNAT